MNQENENINSLIKKIESLSLTEMLDVIVKHYGDDLILASSLGLEDQLLTYHLVNINPKMRIFVLDTGRLNQETYDVLAKTKEKYNINYEIYFPDQNKVERLIANKGPNSFYESVENRKECCHIRKTESLDRVLKTAKAWITGLRKNQSVTRTDLKLCEYDQSRNMIKINPLINWSYEEIFNDIKRYEIPYNVLHEQGYPSIGCAPCTRAIQPGEDQRAGRWWWETPEQKECGIHIVDGKIVRKKRRKSSESNRIKK